MIYSTVEGLKFTRFRVFGEHIPSVKSIGDVMRDRPNEAARLDLQTLSNHICEIYDQECKNEYPPDLPENEQARNKIDLFREEWGHTEAICKQIKYDFYELVVSRYIVFWYRFVAGNISGGNPQNTIRGKNPPKGYAEPILRLRKYPDFARAEAYLNSFSELVNSAMSGGDVIVFKLQSDIENIHIGLAKIEETRRKKGKASSFYCEYCQSYHTFDDLKVRATCGSPECETKHDTQRKRTERVLKLSDFIAGFDGNPKRCKVCKYKRVVNDERVCQPCLVEPV